MKSFLIKTLISVVLVSVTYIACLYGFLSLVKSDLNMLLQANQTISRFQGLSYDLTSLGPYLITNLKQKYSLEVTKLEISNVKNQYSRIFNQKRIFFKSFRVKANTKDILVSYEANIPDSVFIYLILGATFFSVLTLLAVFFIRFLIREKRNKYLANVVLQVVHDIRSPLAVLNNIEFDKENISGVFTRVKKSVERIEEIIFDVASPYNLNLVEKMNIDLISLCREMILEKKIEYKHLSGISFFVDLHNEPEVFSEVNAGILKRVLSNLINNSVEAIKEKSTDGVLAGEVKLSVYEEGGFNIIQISDNGCGMSPETLSSIEKYRFTTKTSGKGLGISYARKVLSSFDGKLRVESQEGISTEVYVGIPKVDQTRNCISSFNFDDLTRLIIIDDDPSIHSFWQTKVNEFQDGVLFFYNPDEFLNSGCQVVGSDLVLCDYEFKNSPLKGDSVAKRFLGHKNFALVTSFYNIQLLKSQLDPGVRVYSKNQMLNFINHQVVVLIDNDKLMHVEWSHYLKGSKRQIFCFKSVDEFLASNFKNLQASIFIDWNLGDGLNGDTESEKVHDRGFKNLYFTTGLASTDLNKPVWIKEIYGKNPRKISFLI